MGYYVKFARGVTTLPYWGVAVCVPFDVNIEVNRRFGLKPAKNWIFTETIVHRQ